MRNPGMFLVMLLAVWQPVFGMEQVALSSVNVDVSDKARLQRGARAFMNYCSGCHSLRYLRYSKMAEGLGLVGFDGAVDQDLLKNNLIFTKAAVNDPVRVAMPPADSRQWFGIAPPDLTLEVRRRGADWVFTYLRSFYADPARPFGTNNLLIPGVGMPDVLAPLRGRVVHVPESATAGDPEHAHLVQVQPGAMTMPEFEETLESLVNFLAWASEPIQEERRRIGWGVLVFLAVLFFLVRRLKKEIWRMQEERPARRDL